MRVTVTTSPGSRAASNLTTLATVAVRARHLFPVDLREACAAQLLKLGVERLLTLGIAETAVLPVSFGHIKT